MCSRHALCRFRPCLEALEARAVPSGGSFAPVVSPALPAPVSLCVVDRLTDTGAGGGWAGDLRYCINRANASPSPDRIAFAVTGTINLARALPDLQGDVRIQGPGADRVTVRRSTISAFYRIFTVPVGATVTISGLTLTWGVTANRGGGAILNLGTLSIADSVFAGNATLDSAAGGAIYNEGVLTVIGSVFADNWTSGVADGGAIYNEGALTVRDTTFRDNGAGGDGNGRGGAIYNAGQLSIHSSTVAANIAMGNSCGDCAGGGIYNDSMGTLRISGSTVSNNRVYSGLFSVGGGGIANLGTLTVLNSTLTANNTYWGASGGGIYSSGTVYLRNTILAGNSASNGPDLAGPLASSGHNLMGNSSGGWGYASTDLLNVNPLLGPLQDNGGPMLTHALLPGSPAIDSGDNADAPPWDQRGPGFPRIIGGTIDRGAFEVQGRTAPGQQPLPEAATNDGVDAAALVLLDRPSRRRAFGWGQPGGTAE